MALHFWAWGWGLHTVMVVRFGVWGISSSYRNAYSSALLISHSIQYHISIINTTLNGKTSKGIINIHGDYRPRLHHLPGFRINTSMPIAPRNILCLLSAPPGIHALDGIKRALCAWAVGRHHPAQPWMPLRPPMGRMGWRRRRFTPRQRPKLGRVKDLDVDNLRIGQVPVPPVGRVRPDVLRDRPSRPDGENPGPSGAQRHVQVVSWTVLQKL